MGSDVWNSIRSAEDSARWKCILLPKLLAFTQPYFCALSKKRLFCLDSKWTVPYMFQFSWLRTCHTSTREDSSLLDKEELSAWGKTILRFSARPSIKWRETDYERVGAPPSPGLLLPLIWRTVEIYPTIKFFFTITWPPPNRNSLICVVCDV